MQDKSASAGCQVWHSGLLRNFSTCGPETRRHTVLKVALQPWPTLVGMKSLIEYTTVLGWRRLLQGRPLQPVRPISTCGSGGHIVKMPLIELAMTWTIRLRLCTNVNSRCTGGHSQGHCHSLFQTLFLVHLAHCPVHHSRHCYQRTPGSL